MCSSIRPPSCFPNGSVRRYQSTCPGFRIRPTPDSGASGENGTRISPSHAPGQASEAVMIVIAFPHELRAGIFLQNSVLVQRFAPRCQHFVPSFFLSASTGGRISSSTMAAARKMDGVGTVFTTPRST